MEKQHEMTLTTMFGHNSGKGSGAKFTVYERRRSKREYVFYHD